MVMLAAACEEQRLGSAEELSPRAAGVTGTPRWEVKTPHFQKKILETYLKRPNPKSFFELWPGRILGKAKSVPVTHAESVQEPMCRCAGGRSRCA